jgi:uncharacterized protein YdhG (YjbR/CyaY superfamily)
VGEWTTYDRSGSVYKVTTMRPKTAPKSRSDSKSIENPVDKYLARLPGDKRAALEGLRKLIRAAAPRAAECISYRLPAFRLDGRLLVLFGAATNHCAFYPGSGTAVEAHKRELKGYKTSKGAIQFPPGRPLPSRLVRELVKYRIAENAAQTEHAANGAPRRR